jgi:predicted kinase
MTGTAHLVHGYLCSGKTTFARELEARTGGVRISLDEWMIELTGDNVHLDDELYERLFDLVTAFWPQLAERGLDVILDFGFWSRRSRDATRAVAESSGVRVRLYLAAVPEEVARARCRERTSGGYVLGESGYDSLRRKFEPLGPDEPHEVIASP